MTTTLSRSYELTLDDMDFTVHVMIYGEDIPGFGECPDSEERTFKIDHITQHMDVDVEWPNPRLHPLYEDIHGEVQLRVGDESLEYE